MELSRIWMEAALREETRILESTADNLSSPFGVTLVGSDVYVAITVLASGARGSGATPQPERRASSGSSPALDGGSVGRQSAPPAAMGAFGFDNFDLESCGP